MPDEQVPSETQQPEANPQYQDTPFDQEPPPPSPPPEVADQNPQTPPPQPGDAKEPIVTGASKSEKFQKITGKLKSKKVLIGLGVGLGLILMVIGGILVYNLINESGESTQESQESSVLTQPPALPEQSPPAATGASSFGQMLEGVPEATEEAEIATPEAEEVTSATEEATTATSPATLP